MEVAWFGGGEARRRAGHGARERAEGGASRRGEEVKTWVTKSRKTREGNAWGCARNIREIGAPCRGDSRWREESTAPVVVEVGQPNGRERVGRAQQRQPLLALNRPELAIHEPAQRTRPVRIESDEETRDVGCLEMRKSLVSEVRCDALAPASRIHVRQAPRQRACFTSMGHARLYVAFAFGARERRRAEGFGMTVDTRSAIIARRGAGAVVAGRVLILFRVLLARLSDSAVASRPEAMALHHGLPSGLAHQHPAASRLPCPARSCRCRSASGVGGEDALLRRDICRAASCAHDHEE